MKFPFERLLTCFCRNLGILCSLTVAFFCLYLAASENILAEAPGADVLLFRPKFFSAGLNPPTKIDEENIEIGGIDKRQSSDAKDSNFSSTLQPAPGIFHWMNLNYDIPVRRQSIPLRLLADVDGFVEPGTLTALMGSTGAGKTTLLNVLAGRTSIGEISGQIMYAGEQCSDALRRRIGFVQQQDVHLSTSTVREALQFSARMRLTNSTVDEKMAYVEEVINVLGMKRYADAMVGTVGQGLNVEQLRRLSIAVELVAKPDILFLDEPTSGLDSQTAWAICSLLQDLARHGQAILCTVHQPSANLFEMFDKLLLIKKGGETLYYGDIGPNARTVTGYFENKSSAAHGYTNTQNPAEWIFDTTTDSTVDWAQEWKVSSRCAEFRKKLNQLPKSGSIIPHAMHSGVTQKRFALTLVSQIATLTKRNFVCYWRTPQYLWCNLLFSMCAATLISVSCPSDHKGLQGIKSQLFALFLFCTIFSNLSHQIIPRFVKNRELFEVREGRSRMYSWKAFLTSMMIFEAFWSTLASVLAFLLFYFPLGLYNGRNTDALLAWFYTWAFFLFTSTMSHLLIAGLEQAEAAANYGFLLFYLCLIFCGVLVPKDQLPRFWVFMYRVSPLTYIIAGLSAVGIANRTVSCLDSEFLILNPPSKMTCGDYLAPYLQSSGASLLNPKADTACRICPISKTDQFLASLNIERQSRWEYLGYILVFICFNVASTFIIYYFGRVPKRQGRKV